LAALSVTVKCCFVKLSNLLAACFVLLCFLAYRLDLKMKATYSFEILVNFHQNTQLYIPEDINLQNDHYESLKHYISITVTQLRYFFPGLPCHISLNGYNSSSHSPPHTGSMMLGQEGLLPHGIKSPSTPLHSPTRGHLFLSDHHSENSNDPAVTSEQEDEDESMRADPRIDLIEHRGDPRDDLRASEEAEDRGIGSPTGPLSLTTNDKDNAETSPKSNILTEVSQ
jgi:hypothetical protein